MSTESVAVLAVIGSLHEASASKAVVRHVAELLRDDGARVDLLDLGSEPLALLNPERSFQEPGYPALRERVLRADVILIGTPDYHGCMSGATKNFLDHFWREFAGKLFATVVASHEKGLTVTDQLRTVARQCYAWSLPYGVAVEDKVDLKDGEIVTESLRQRLTMLRRDIQVYGALLANQRRQDLAGSDPGFLARLRPR